MLTYKKWKQLNESFGSVTLGLSTPSTLGGVVGAQNITPEEAEGEELDEGKKKSCKCDKKPCVCTKKMLDMDPEVLKKITSSDDDEEADLDVTSDDEEIDVDELGDESDDEISDDEVSDEEEEEDDDETLVLKKKSIEDMSPMMQKKKMCGGKKSGGKKSGGKKKCKHMKKKMTKEDAEWWQSVHDMMDVKHTTDKHWDGISEDQLYAPKNANDGLEGDSGEPGPGEPGYAPQTRIGTPFG